MSPDRSSLTHRAFQWLGVLAILVGLVPTAAGASLRFITIDVAPWAFRDAQDDSLKGAFVMMVRELAERTGHDLDITLTPFARVDRELESGGHDCTILIPRPDEVVVRGALVSHHDIGVVPRRGIELNDYASLSGHIISKLRGAAITPKFDRDGQLNTVADTGYLIALRKLARGRVDAIAGAIPTIRYLAEQNGLSEYLGEPLPLEQVPLVFQCSRQSEHLDTMDVFNDAIEAMKADGTIERIRETYYF